jgi:hypothetical protein
VYWIITLSLDDGKSVAKRIVISNFWWDVGPFASGRIIFEGLEDISILGIVLLKEV